MKNRNNICTITLVALTFALAPVTKAAQHPDGGPSPMVGRRLTVVLPTRFPLRAAMRTVTVRTTVRTSR